MHRRPLMTGRLHDDPGRVRQRGLTHVRGQRAVVVQYDVLHSGPRTDPYRLVPGESRLGQIPDEDPDAVPAHLRDRTVRIPVVHEPVAAVLDVRLLVSPD